MRAERALLPARLFLMETSTSEYREFAQECERLARQATSEHHRAILLEMAEAFRQLAAEANAKTKRST